jgi:hypothetical protein
MRVLVPGLWRVPGQPAATGDAYAAAAVLPCTSTTVPRPPRSASTTPGPGASCCLKAPKQRYRHAPTYVRGTAFPDSLLMAQFKLLETEGRSDINVGEDLFDLRESGRIDEVTGGVLQGSANRCCLHEGMVPQLVRPIIIQTAIALLPGARSQGESVRFFGLVSAGLVTCVAAHLPGRDD